MQEELLNHMKMIYEMQINNGYQESTEKSHRQERKKWDFELGKVSK